MNHCVRITGPGIDYNSMIADADDVDAAVLVLNKIRRTLNGNKADMVAGTKSTANDASPTPRGMLPNSLGSELSERAVE